MSISNQLGWSELKLDFSIRHFFHDVDWSFEKQFFLDRSVSPPFSNFFSKRKVEFVRNSAQLTAGFEKPKEREPTSSSSVGRRQRAGVVGHRMIVEEETRADVEGHEDVDAVVFVAGQDEEDAEQVHDPRRRMEIVPVIRCIWNRKRKD